jgi:hypothetical protein
MCEKFPLDGLPAEYYKLFIFATGPVLRSQSKSGEIVENAGAKLVAKWLLTFC